MTDHKAAVEYIRFLEKNSICTAIGQQFVLSVRRNAEKQQKIKKIVERILK